jgi:class 3 adenylate cyclase/streptogramin lyase
LQEDDKGNVWIGTEGGGMCYFDKKLGHFRIFRHDPSNVHSLGSDEVYSLEFDHAGRLWIGTSNGLNFIEPGSNQIERYAFPERNFNSQTIIQLYVDSRGFLWISWSLEGITRLNIETGELKNYWRHPDSGFGDVSCIMEDFMGQMWFGSRTSGLCKLNILQNKATYFKSESSPSTHLGSNSIYALHQDSKGRIWIGTRGAGLDLILLQEDGTQQFKSFTTAQGLTDNWVYGINEDDKGNIWITSSEGLSIIKSNSSEIQSLKLISANQGAFHKGEHSGLLYLGSEGFDFFAPESMQLPPPSSHMVVNNIKKYNREQRTGIPEPIPGLFTKEEIELSYKDNIVEIDFLNISYDSQNERAYAYMMENFNKEWIHIGTQRSITFTGLPPGNYHFKVRPVLPSGQLGAGMAGIRMHIAPPWYFNSITKIMYLLLFIALIFGYIHLRTKSLKTRQRQLELVVEERTQQLKLKNEEVTQQRERSDALLLNILPRDVAEELKTAGRTSPVKYDDVSVLFADFKEFTNIVATIPGTKLVEELDDLFERFDEIMEEEGLEKIQTIGDAYLAVSGLPKTAPDHAQRCVKAAIRMISYLDNRNLVSSLKWKIRIGIHSGPVIAGIVGKKKFSYNIFGDTVNIAARIQTKSEEGRINVSAYTHELLKGKYSFTYRGKIDAKGKGEIDMYFVDKVLG